MARMVERETGQRTDLADLVRERRAELKLSYVRLSKLCVDPLSDIVLGPSWLHRLETGLPVIPPELPQLRAMAEGLGLPLGKLQDAAGAQFHGLPVNVTRPGVRILMEHADELTDEDIDALTEIAKVFRRRRRTDTDE